ncbi:hypothetical protein [Pontibacter ruber]|uniref:DUF937 domain-containing protein n=1 Tax=Pontibacter ruber TaxID=1343895 RepID=A0ABW5D4D1_9BACT|nr:hypothetical protein [Pontibacter ruber]
MLENIINSVKGQLTGELQSKFNLNPTQANQSVDLAKENVETGLKQQAAGGDIGGIMNMLKGGPSTAGSHPAVGGIINNYVHDLSIKLGIPAGVASQVGPYVIQFIMGKLSGKVSSGETSQSDLMGMLGGLGGKLPGGLGDKLGGMFK